jgi:hypothetical protein
MWRPTSEAMHGNSEADDALLQLPQKKHNEIGVHQQINKHGEISRKNGTEPPEMRAENAKNAKTTNQNGV